MNGKMALVALISLLSVSPAPAQLQRAPAPDQRTLSVIGKIGSCVVEKDPEEARDLVMANQSPELISRMTSFVRKHPGCGHSDTPANLVYFSGAMAQSLIRKDNLSVARLEISSAEASKPEACLIDRGREKADRLLMTSWATPEFDEAFSQLSEVAAFCFRENSQLLAYPEFIVARTAIYAFRRSLNLAQR